MLRNISFFFFFPQCTREWTLVACERRLLRGWGWGWGWGAARGGVQRGVKQWQCSPADHQAPGTRHQPLQPRHSQAVLSPSQRIDARKHLNLRTWPPNVHCMILFFTLSIPLRCWTLPVISSTCYVLGISKNQYLFLEKCATLEFIVLIICVSHFNGHCTSRWLLLWAWYQDKLIHTPWNR